LVFHRNGYNSYKDPNSSQYILKSLIEVDLGLTDPRQGFREITGLEFKREREFEKTGDISKLVNSLPPIDEERMSLLSSPSKEEKPESKVDFVVSGKSKYALWVKDNAEELNINLETIVQYSGINKISLKAVLNSERNVKPEEDKALNKIFYPVNMNYLPEIIRRYRNDSRYSNTQLSVESKVPIKSLKEIISADRNPNPFEAEALTKTLQIDGVLKEKILKAAGVKDYMEKSRPSLKIVGRIEDFLSK